MPKVSIRDIEEFTNGYEFPHFGFCNECYKLELMSLEHKCEPLTVSRIRYNLKSSKNCNHLECWRQGRCIISDGWRKSELEKCKITKFIDNLVSAGLYIYFDDVPIVTMELFNRCGIKMGFEKQDINSWDCKPEILNAQILQVGKWRPKAYFRLLQWINNSDSGSLLTDKAIEICGNQLTQFHSCSFDPLIDTILSVYYRTYLHLLPYLAEIFSFSQIHQIANSKRDGPFKKTRFEDLLEVIQEKTAKNIYKRIFKKFVIPELQWTVLDKTFKPGGSGFQEAKNHFIALQ